MAGKRKKVFWWVAGTSIALIILLHVVLEPVVLRYANKALANLQDYRGHIHDIDIALYRGAYRIDSLNIEKIDGGFPQPFLSIQVVDISIEWKALFRGAIVGKITLEKPVLNFTVSPSGDTQTGSNEDWLQTINDLIPIKINRFEITNGKIYYHDLSTDPEVNVVASNLNAVATNLNTVRDKNKKLPAHINLTSNTSGNGHIVLDIGLNPLEQIPDFDLTMELERMDLSYLKDFTDAYAGFTFKEGKLGVYSEVAMNNGKYDGYIKPLLKNVKVTDIGDESSSLWRKIWEVIVGTTMEVFENQRKDQFATKVPFSGDVSDSDVGILATIGNILKNAFIIAFRENVDQTVNIQSMEDDESKGGLFDFLKKDDAGSE